MIDDVRVVRRNHDGRHPLEPFLQVSGSLPQLQLGICDHVPALVLGHVHPVDGSAVAATPDDVGVVGVERDGPGLARRRVQPVGLGVQGARRRPRRHADARVVLLRTVEAVREAVVDDHVVELRGGLVVVGGPRLAAVHRHLCAAVVGHDHDVGCRPG